MTQEQRETVIGVTGALDVVAAYLTMVGAKALSGVVITQIEALAAMLDTDAKA